MKTYCLVCKSYADNRKPSLFIFYSKSCKKQTKINVKIKLFSVWK